MYVYCLLFLKVDDLFLFNILKTPTFGGETTSLDNSLTDKASVRLNIKGIICVSNFLSSLPSPIERFGAEH